MPSAATHLSALDRLPGAVRSEVHLAGDTVNDQPEGPMSWDRLGDAVASYLDLVEAAVQPGAGRESQGSAGAFSAAVLRARRS